MCRRNPSFSLSFKPFSHSFSGIYLSFIGVCLFPSGTYLSFSRIYLFLSGIHLSFIGIYLSFFRIYLFLYGVYLSLFGAYPYFIGINLFLYGVYLSLFGVCTYFIGIYLFLFGTYLCFIGIHLFFSGIWLCFFGISVSFSGRRIGFTGFDNQPDRLGNGLFCGFSRFVCPTPRLYSVQQSPDSNRPETTPGPVYAARSYRHGNGKSLSIKGNRVSFPTPCFPFLKKRTTSG